MTAVRLLPLRYKPYQRGFTLIEVLVALVIVALVLAAALRATGLLTAGQHALTQSTMAAWSAENTLASLRLARALPAVGTTETACPQADLGLLCTVEVSPSPNIAMRRADVRVVLNDDRSHTLAHRTAFLSALP